MTMIFLLLAIPSVVFGIYWVPVLGWVKESLLLFVQGCNIAPIFGIN
ncbi:MAG: hypothetical protein CM1200mP10_15400 [Candidatus Neomarinimicrobiota bacterium]|nr:MAG: hypothetical protein CM1200mP10_15400 [Candidatus Neomarinimicrobiota bacterium]